MASGTAICCEICTIPSILPCMSVCYCTHACMQITILVGNSGHTAHHMQYPTQGARTEEFPTCLAQNVCCFLQGLEKNLDDEELLFPFNRAAGVLTDASSMICAFTCLGRYVQPRESWYSLHSPDVSRVVLISFSAQLCVCALS